jgi:hypothetical protein
MVARRGRARTKGSQRGSDKMRQERLSIAAWACLAAAAPAAAQNEEVWNFPTFDRWNYPFASTPGVEASAPAFASPFVPGLFDDRDGQFLVSFITSDRVAPGMGASNYVITSARVTATTSNNLGWFYDPTPDPWQSSVPPFDPEWVPDLDPGRAVELLGTGFRNGFDALSFGETGPYSFADPLLEDVRNAYGAAHDAGGTLIDVSNSVRDRYDAALFAIGLTDGVLPGEEVPANTTFTFDLNLDDALVVSYLQAALDAGIASFTIASLEVAMQGGPVNYPVWHTKENTVGGLAATLSLTVTIIPPPAGWLLAGVGGLMCVRRRRSGGCVVG